MIGHKHIGAQGAIKAAWRPAQFLKIEPIVFLLAKARLAIVAALDDTLREYGEIRSALPGHDGHPKKGDTRYFAEAPAA
jgi:hypothetical protein